MFTTRHTRRFAAALGLALAVAVPVAQAAGETPQSAADRTGAWEASLIGVTAQPVPVIPRLPEEMATFTSPQGSFRADGQVPCQGPRRIELAQPMWASWSHIVTARRGAFRNRLLDVSAPAVMLHEIGHVLSGVQCNWTTRDGQRKEESIVEANMEQMFPAWCRKFLALQCPRPLPPDAYANDVTYLRQKVVTLTGVGINKPASVHLLRSLLAGDQAYRDAVLGTYPDE